MLLQGNEEGGGVAHGDVGDGQNLPAAVRAKICT